MERQGWSRERLSDLVAGREVCLRDPGGGVVDVPDWLAAAAAEVIGGDSAAYMERTHPDDCGAFFDAFDRALKNPGELSTAQIRLRYERQWHHVETTWLNLCDDDLGALLFVATICDGPFIVGPIERGRGDHEATDWMVLTLDENAQIVSVEGRIEELLGFHADEVVGRRPSDFLPPEDTSDGVALWISLRSQEGNTATSRRPWVRKDGGEIWLESSYVNLGDRGSGTTVFAVMWDITERRAQEEALRQHDAELRQLANDFQLLADEVPSAAFRCDAEGTIIFHNARWSELLPDRDGATRLHDIVAPDDHRELDAALADRGSTSGAEGRSLELAGRDGTTVWRLTLRSMGHRGSGPRHFVGSVNDVSATVHLRHEARRDALTDLLNRAAIDEQIASALVEDRDGLLVVFIDLDGFKGVNDTYGHECGDVVLQEIGRRLSLGVRPEDAVGRYGGDEFVVVCRNAAGADPAGITARLEIALAGPIDFGSGCWRPRASIGTARPEPGEDLVAVMHRADMAMFEVKRARASSRSNESTGTRSPLLAFCDQQRTRLTGIFRR